MARDSCSLQQNEHKIAVMDSCFLDDSNKKVRAYRSEKIRRMVEDYGIVFLNKQVSSGRAR